MATPEKIHKQESDRSPEDLYHAFINGQLAYNEWTHRSHLVAGWMASQTRTPADTLSHLRAAITAHNCGVGIVNDDDSGYHETLTAYYVTAIAETSAMTLDALFEDPACAADAPLRHWTRELLFSVEGRRGWVEPDLVALPWPIVSDRSALT